MRLYAHAPACFHRGKGMKFFLFRQTGGAKKGCVSLAAYQRAGGFDDGVYAACLVLVGECHRHVRIYA